MNVDDRLKHFIWIVQDIKHKGIWTYCYNGPTDQECFNFFYFLLGVSIEDFVSVFPLHKVYDEEKQQIKDYYYSKRALDTLLSSGKTTFESAEDIFEFFFEVQIENEIVRDIVIKALKYVIHAGGYNAFDVIDIIEERSYYRKGKKNVSYLRPVK